MSQTTTYQVILSSDGKHTIMATTDGMELTKEALDWATSTYDQVVKRYGTKADLYKASSNGNGAVPMCGIHKTPMARVQGKLGPFWSCHQRDEAGNFCSYKQNER